MKQLAEWKTIQNLIKVLLQSDLSGLSTGPLI